MGRGRSIATSCWPAWLNATALLLVSFVAVAALSLQVRPGLEVVAVAFPPWWNSQQIFAWLTIDPQAVAGCFNTDKEI
jgi:hypothetical protein